MYQKSTINFLNPTNCEIAINAMVVYYVGSAQQKKIRDLDPSNCCKYTSRQEPKIGLVDCNQGCGSWSALYWEQICIWVKSWIRIRIRVKILGCLGSKWSHGGPWTLTMEAWRLKMKPWKVFPIRIILWGAGSRSECALKRNVESGSARKWTEGSGTRNNSFLSRPGTNSAYESKDQQHWPWKSAGHTALMNISAISIRYLD